MQMQSGTKTTVRTWGLLVALVGVGFSTTVLAGCDNFFVNVTNNTTGSNGSVDYVYQANSGTGSTYVNGYNLSSGSLVATSSSPYSLGFAPVAMAVVPGNGILYAAATNSNAVYAYQISSSGALTSLNSGNIVASDDATAMAVSPDGAYLFIADAAINTTTTAYTISEYKINSSTGALTNQVVTTINATSGNFPYALAMAPSGQYLAVAMGTSGTYVFPYTESSGAVAGGNAVNIPTAGSGSADVSVAFDSNNELYVARTNQLASYAITTSNSNAAYKLVGTAQTIAGASPYSVAVKGTSYVYVSAGSNPLNSSTAAGIYAFSASSGVLTALAGNPVTAPNDVSQIGVDSSGNYLLSAGYGATTGVQIFAIGSTGKLSSNGYASTGTSTSVLTSFALTH